MAVSLAVFPALSTAVPVTGCPAPSVATFCGVVQDTTPDVGSASAHVKVTVTALLFQPFPLAAGDWTCVIVGFVLSMRIVTVECASSFPAASTLQYSSECVPSEAISIAVYRVRFDPETLAPSGEPIASLEVPVARE